MGGRRVCSLKRLIIIHSHSTRVGRVSRISFKKISTEFQVSFIEKGFE